MILLTFQPRFLFSLSYFWFTFCLSTAVFSAEAAQRCQSIATFFSVTVKTQIADDAIKAKVLLSSIKNMVWKKSFLCRLQFQINIQVDNLIVINAYLCTFMILWNDFLLKNINSKLWVKKIKQGKQGSYQTTFLLKHLHFRTRTFDRMYLFLAYAGLEVLPQTFLVSQSCACHFQELGLNSSEFLLWDER